MIRKSFLAASILALTGCASSLPSSGPEAQGVMLPAAYDYDRGVAQASASNQDWWISFGSAPLDELISEALSANQTLAGGIANVDAARAALKVANASRLPQASGSVSASSDTQSGLDDFSASARVSASYQLDLFGANSANRDAALASLEATEYGQRALALTVESQVAETYFNLLAAREQLNVAEQNLAISERIFQIVEIRYQAGAISGFDVSSQRAQLANARARIPQLDSQIASLETALAILLGRTPQGFQAPEEQILDIALPSISPGLPSELLLRRPDLMQAEANLSASNANIVAARAAFFPSIDLGTGLTSLLSGGGDLTGTISASLAQTIFSGGRLEGQLESAIARRQAQLSTYRGAILSALRDVDVSLSAIEAAASREEQLLVARDASRDALEAAELRYKAGTDDLTSLLTAQQSYFTASDNLVQARLDRLTSSLSLYAALGGT